MLRCFRTFSDHWPIHAAGVGALTALTSCAYLLCIAPVVHQQQTYAQQAGDLSRLLNTIDGMAGTLQHTKEAAASARQVLQAAELHLYPESEINRRLGNLTELAERCRLRTDVLDPDLLVAGEPYGTVSMRLSGSGGYRECAQFLRLLRSELPDMGLTSFELRGVPGPRSLPATFTFELVWYTQPSGSSVKYEQLRPSDQ